MGEKWALANNVMLVPTAQRQLLEFSAVGGAAVLLTLPCSPARVLCNTAGSGSRELNQPSGRPHALAHEALVLASPASLVSTQANECQAVSGSGRVSHPQGRDLCLAAGRLSAAGGQQLHVRSEGLEAK